MMQRGSALVIAGLLGAAGISGCNSKELGGTPGASIVPQDVQAIIFLQRKARGGTGNVFDYTDYAPGGRLVKLTPPAADGTLEVLTDEAIFAQADIMSWDLSYDARTIVISARLGNRERYQLFTMDVNGQNVKQITEGSSHYVYPVFVPGQRIMFMTSKVVEAGAQQFRDEYERQTTSQVGVINMDGTGETLGPRNVSHRVAPAVLANGKVVYTEWRHLGRINDGHLRVMNADMTGMAEAFGGEGRGVTNSYLKARHVESYTTAAGKASERVIAVATSREETLQAGKLILISLGDDEATSSYEDLTPFVPGGDGPSRPGIGRYYDAEILGNPADRRFLVSWADGPVQSEILEQAGAVADFGVYVFDAKTGVRHPLYNQADMWDVMARPVRPRPEPMATQSPVASGETGFVVGALDVYQSSVAKIPAGEAIKVRLLEGFSSEEGFPNMFGLSEFDGQSRYGEVPVYPDGSFAARVPADVPLHMQVIDRFAMAIVSEDIWISGRAGEQRFCGGCHENRAQATQIAPGTTEAVQRGPIDLNVSREQRLSLDFSYEKVRGVPWDLALQPIFDAKCVGCHDGDPAKPGNKSYTITDMTLGTSQTITFNLSATKIPIVVGERSQGTEFPASYISMVGLGMELGENQVQITGDYFQYVEPGSARKSKVIEKLNPPQRWPVANPAVRAFAGGSHPADVGGVELTPDEHYLLILNIDMGAQFFFRENKRGDY